jgi:hypothetical protein
MNSPPNTLLPELEQLLASRSPQVAENIRRVVRDVRPCVRLRSQRIGDKPLRGGMLDRLLRRPRPSPLLPAIASKFGGLPYFESEAELEGGCFLGQVNFADATRALKENGFPIPAGMPERGLLAVDIPKKGSGGRTRWYPSPRPRDASTFEVDAVAKYETAINFEGSWSLRGLEWFDAVPEQDAELWEYMNDLEIAGVDVDAHGGHKLFGHANEALNDHYGLMSISGRGNSIRDYALIWRIDYDNPAGFSWGTNLLYVVIHRDDLARGSFENAIVIGANA